MPISASGTINTSDVVIARSRRRQSNPERPAPDILYCRVTRCCASHSDSLLASTFANNRGFTFIEIAVVLIILGLVINAALFATGGLGTERLVKSETAALHMTLNSLRRQAVLQGRPIGLQLEETRYLPVTFADDGNWVAAASLQALENDMDAALRVTSEPNEKNAPVTVFFPGGDYLPFTITLAARDKETPLRKTVSGDGINDLELK